MTEVRETKLPGVGVRHEFQTDRGQQVGVLVHRDGRREVLIYDVEDPDACSSVLKLSHDDTRTLSELLGASQVVEEVEAATHEIEGLTIDWIELRPETAADGVTIADGAYRKRTGASIVAVTRSGDPVPAPEPDFVLRGGDTVVAAGTIEGVAALRAILRP